MTPEQTCACTDEYICLACEHRMLQEEFDSAPEVASEDIEDGYGGWQDDPCPEFDG